MIRILIVDDHPVVRKGLTYIIEPEPDMEVVATASNGPEAVELFRNVMPDVTIMDLRLTPDMSGIQALQAIRSETPAARVVILTASKGDEDVYQAIQAGAATYLLKDMLNDDLIPIIREVHAGGGPIPPEIAQRLANRVRHPELTTREIAVVELMAKGLRNKEIGGKLDITDQTVQGHVKNIFEKLDVHDRTEAVMVAIRRGIIHPDQ